MKKLALLLFLLLSSVSWSADLISPSVLSEAQARLVHVMLLYVDQSGQVFEQHGSGAWIDADHVLTAAHVIVPARPCEGYAVQVFTKNKTQVFTIDKMSPRYDLAILKSIRPSNYKAVKFSNQIPIEGKPVFFWTTYNHIRDVKKEMVDVLGIGTIAARNVSMNSCRNFLINSMILSGASGSVVFDEKGDVIGVVRAYQTGIRPGENWYIYATDVAIVRFWLSR